MFEYSEDAARVVAELRARIGEGAPQPRLEPVRRVVDLLGDPQRAYPVIHVTGTNGKTSTSRIIESILRAYGLRTGLMTSPDLFRVNERIRIDGESIGDDALVRNWEDVQPYVVMVDAELAVSGEPALTYFEALTVLAFAAFADAPVDVAVLEVGMGGEWDSTNVADGQVAVLTPIALDHTHRLGTTIGEIARTKAGIIKPIAEVVSAAQTAEAMGEIEQAVQLTESNLHTEGVSFEVTASSVAVGGQLVSVRGLAGSYDDLFLPLFGDHQAHNAAVAIAAVEAFLGRGTQPLEAKLLAEGLATATSPGRLQPIASDPTVIVDAAHNPHGARSLAASIRKYFDVEEIGLVLGVLADKDAVSMVVELEDVVDRWFPTASGSDRALPAEELAEVLAGRDAVAWPMPLPEAIAAARRWALEASGRAVVIAGSITLIADAMRLGHEEGWAR